MFPRKFGLVVVLLVLFTAACKRTDSPDAEVSSAVIDGGTANAQPVDPQAASDETDGQEADAGATDAGQTSTSTSKSALRIKRFVAKPAAIDQGQSTVLRWNTSGATKVRIEPGSGVVTGNKLRVFPKGNQTYTLIATKGNRSIEATATVQVLDDGSDWQVTESPPKLINPQKINLRNVRPGSNGARDIHCGGSVYKVNLENDDDAIVYMSGSKPLAYPVHITGGRNVRIVGLDIDVITQPGCGVGELPNHPAKKHPNSNIHPRLPGATVLRLQQWGTTFVEGVNIDVRGHQADCIVSRNPDGMNNSVASKKRNVVIQNSVCKGVEGMGKTPIGEGIHGDLFQNQGNDVLNRLVFENVSLRTSQEGIVLHGGGSDGKRGTRELIIRNYDYSWDPRYVGDDSYESFGLAFSGKPGNKWTLDNLRIDAYRDGGDYIMINGQRYGDSHKRNVQSHPGIKSGLPPIGSFALSQKTGVNYRSPHGNVPGH